MALALRRRMTRVRAGTSCQKQSIVQKRENLLHKCMSQQHRSQWAASTAASVRHKTPERWQPLWVSNDWWKKRGLLTLPFPFIFIVQKNAAISILLSNWQQRFQIKVARGRCVRCAQCRRIEKKRCKGTGSKSISYRTPFPRVTHTLRFSMY